MADNETKEASPSQAEGVQQKSAPAGPTHRRVVRGKAPELPIFENKNWLIHLHYVRKELDACKSLIHEQLQETQGMCEYALYVQGLIERRDGNIEMSLDFFKQAHQLNKQSAAVTKQVARSLFLLGRHRAALEAYNDAARLSPRDWEICHNQGVCYIHLKDYSQARECLRKAIQLNRAVISFIHLGRVYLLQGEISMAQDLYRHAVEFNPENPDLMATLGLLYLETSQPQKAMNMLGNALTYDPTHFKAILAAGSIIQGQGDNDVALTKYRAVIQTAPESPQLWNNIGMCFFGKGKHVAAISCLKRASYLAPFEWKIQYNLGLVHLTFKQYASAFHFLKAALTLRPRNGQIFMLLAVALTHLDDFETARKAYEQAAGLEPTNPTIRLNYSLCLYKAGDHRAASQQFKFFEENFTAQQGEVDPEVLAVSSRLGPALQVGEELVWRETVAAAGNHPMKNSPKPRNSDGSQGTRKPMATAGQS